MAEAPVVERKMTEEGFGRLPDDGRQCGLADKEALREHFMSGAKEIWLIDPERIAVTVYKSLTEVPVFHAGEAITGGEVSPNVRCGVTRCVAVA